MSFILDALKKSESDRQRQSGPSLFEVKVTPPRRTLPVWAVAIAVLLGINVVVISWMLLRRAPAGAAASAPAAAPAPATAARGLGAPASAKTTPAPIGANAAAAAGPAAARVSAPPATPLPPPGSLSPSPVPAAAGSGQPVAPDAASGTRQGAVQAPPDAHAGDSAPAIEPSAVRGSGASVTAGDALPLYQQVSASDGLPALHLDLHVYARIPRDRFVMINMHKLVEGDSLPDGVHVDAIRPDGVVLSYHGTQFLLPRD